MVRRLALWLFTLAWLVLPAGLSAVSVPAPTGYVNDFAHLLTPTQATELDRQLAEFDRRTGNQLAVATITKLNNETIEEAAVKIFEQWQIGRRHKDNGILLLVAKDDHKVRIEVGYGLEPAVTDAQAGAIIREHITPAFRDGRYYDGLEAGLGALQQRIAADQANISPPPTAGADSGGNWGNWLFAAFFLAGPVLSYLGSFLARSKSWWAGGVLGAGAGYGGGQLLLHNAGLGLVAAGILGIFGLMLDFILSHNYQRRRRRGLNTGWWSSGGGFFGGGDSGYGGFGGFGGGGSGGGGASGDW